MIYLLRDSDRSYFDTKKYFSGGVRRISGNELYTKIVKCKDGKVTKGNNWAKSVGGLYYQNLNVSGEFPKDAKILAVVITEWSGLSTQVNAVVNGNDIQLTANTYMPFIASTSYIKYRVAYI